MVAVRRERYGLASRAALAVSALEFLFLAAIVLIIFMVEL
jgi:hypothetical protein